MMYEASIVSHRPPLVLSLNNSTLNQYAAENADINVNTLDKLTFRLLL